MMKKFYFVLAVAIAALFSQQLSAQVVLSGPDDVKFYDGRNYYQAGQSIAHSPDYLSVSCPDGYIFNTITVNGKAVYNYDTATKAINSYAWESYKFDYPIARMEVSTMRMSKVQTASYTVKSDKDFWYIDYNNSFSALDSYNTVAAGETVKKFIPGRDSLVIDYSWYKDYYNITRNGELITLKKEHNYDMGIKVPIENGDVIEVVTEVPETMCRVDFVSPNGETGFITDFHYIVYDENSRPVYTYLDPADTYYVPAGSIVDFYWNYNDFKEPINDGQDAYKGALNGKEVEFDFYDGFSIPVDRDHIVVSMLAERHSPIDIQIDIDKASYAVVKSGDNILELHDGLQTITIMENQDLLIYPTSSSVLKSITANGKEYLNTNQNYINPGFYELIYSNVCKSLTGGTENDIIKITTEKRERTIPVKVFVDGCGGNVQLFTDSYIDSPYYFGLAEGENSLMMHKDDLYKLKTVFSDDYADGYVYAYPKSASKSGGIYTITVYPYNNVDYEVIRIYGDGYPAYHSVNVISEFDDADYTLRRDYHIALSGKSHNLPDGTVFHIDMAEGKSAEVYVNNEKLNSASAQSHSFIVTEPATVEIKDATTGIEDVAADSDEAPVYYNLQGVRVNNPSNGIYIEVRNGKATRRYFN